MSQEHCHSPVHRYTRCLTLGEVELEDDAVYSRVGRDRIKTIPNGEQPVLWTTRPPSEHIDLLTTLRTLSNCRSITLHRSLVDSFDLFRQVLLDPQPICIFVAISVMNSAMISCGSGTALMSHCFARRSISAFSFHLRLDSHFYTNQHIISKMTIVG